MYKLKNKSDSGYRTFHKVFGVLSVSTVLFVLSACNRQNVSPAVLDNDFSDEIISETEIVSETETTSSAAGVITTDIETAGGITAGTESTEGITPDTETATNMPVSGTGETSSPAAETTAPAVTEPAPLTFSGQNAALLSRINSTYGVNIRYGSDVIWSHDISVSGITDDELIFSRLNMLETCLMRYPLSFFSDLNAYSPIIINLVDTLGGADGYTDGSDGNPIEIALSCDNSDLYFALAFHHELFHFIEYCIMYNFDDYDELLDTDEYTDTTLYGTGDYSGTIYETDTDIYGQYFTSIYGKTNRLEDRAELFSYYMGNTVKECMRYFDTPISLKMKRIAEAIRICCPSLADYERGELPWERKIAY